MYKEKVSEKSATVLSNLSQRRSPSLVHAIFPNTLLINLYTFIPLYNERLPVHTVFKN